LRAWRRDEARARAVPAYVVLHDKTIEAIAASQPHSQKDLTAIPGIGPAKLAQYGEAILLVMREARREPPASDRDLDHDLQD
jgi:ATP-dependent DNA helicase RecQ